jgi:hypothetical protein
MHSEPLDTDAGMDMFYEVWADADPKACALHESTGATVKARNRGDLCAPQDLSRRCSSAGKGTIWNRQNVRIQCS